jgi:hypothetical protein
MARIEDTDIIRARKHIVKHIKDYIWSAGAPLEVTGLEAGAPLLKGF